MLVDLYATHSHYRDHTMPIWRAIPDELRGSILQPQTKPRRPTGNLTIVAGRVDVDAMRPKPCVLVEHGSGQTWSNFATRHNVGSLPQPPHVVAYIGPSERAAALWAATPQHHDRPAAAVGCPKLDALLTEAPEPDNRTVAFAWRWNVPTVTTIQCPEQRSALDHYSDALPALIEGWHKRGWRVIGHGHPRARRELTVLWRSLGIRPTWDADEVLRQSGLVIVDYSSFAYEAAALGRSVLLLNAPWYRRDVEHGQRFWSHVPGWQVDSPEELAALPIEAYVDNDSSKMLRERAVAGTYAHIDGHSAQRAADFIVSLVAELERRASARRGAHV